MIELLTLSLAPVRGNINLRKKVLWILLVILVVVTPVGCFNEVPLTTNPHDQISPAIYQDMVVWQDNRNGNWDIYGLDLSTGQEFCITTDVHDQISPAIYNDIVVWMDFRNENFDIYGYNVKTGQEFPIAVAPEDQWIPAIYNDIVVWEDRRHGNSDIYGYNLKTLEEFPIAVGPGDQILPAIYEDTVVWVDKGSSWKSKSDIYGYSISTNKGFHVSTIAYYAQPAIYKDTVVWTWSNRYTRRYDILTGEEDEIVTDCLGCPRSHPALYGDVMVWISTDTNVQCYNLLTGEEVTVKTEKSTKGCPAIYDDVVVWEDYRNGNWDVYGYNISDILERLPSLSPSPSFSFSPTERLAPLHDILDTITRNPLEWLLVVICAGVLAAALLQRWREKSGSL